jgi:Mg2+ and Co2+ transporter CorA
MDTDYLESMINQLDRKVRDLEDRVYRAEQDAKNALDDVRRLEDRLRYVETFR